MSKLGKEGTYMSLMESLNGKKKNKRATVTISFKGENRAVAGGGKKRGGRAMVL